MDERWTDEYIKYYKGRIEFSKKGSCYDRYWPNLSLGLLYIIYIYKLVFKLVFSFS